MSTRWFPIWLLAGAFVASACGGDATGPAPPPPPPPPPQPTFPSLLSALNIDAPQALLYEPRWKLWTNGSIKERKVRLLDGGAIDIQDGDRWIYPDGARFTKTFSYFTQSSPNTLVPVETRIILRKDGAWETAAYRWREDLSDADLLTGDAPVPVPVILPDGTSFNHLIPSLANCQTCHGSSPAFILGFSELQLNSPLPGASLTQLEAFQQGSFFDRAIPADPDQVQAADAVTRDILGYVQGNCVHCHNASSPITSLDLSYPVFLQSTVNQMARNGRRLIVPNDPAASFLLDEFEQGIMPLLGVQLLDTGARDMLSDWILQHDFGN